MRTSVLPGFGDLAGLVAYVVHDPHLFISSSTVMTTGVVLAAVVLRVTALRSALAARIQAFVGPSLVLVFAYFGLGSIALATYLYVRLHDVLALETEIQLVSGIGHLVVAAAGVALLLPALRARGAGAWLLANAIAVTYWTAQLAVIRPPWLDFQEQGSLTRPAAFAMLALSAAVTGVLAARSRDRVLSFAIRPERSPSR